MPEKKLPIVVTLFSMLKYGSAAERRRDRPERCRIGLHPPSSVTGAGLEEHICKVRALETFMYNTKMFYSMATPHLGMDNHDMEVEKKLI